MRLRYYVLRISCARGKHTFPIYVCAASRYEQYNIFTDPRLKLFRLNRPSYSIVLTFGQYPQRTVREDYSKKIHPIMG